MLLNRKKEIPLVDDPVIASNTEHRLVELLFKSSEFSIFPFMALGIGFWWLLCQSQPYFWPTAWLLVFESLQLLRLGHIGRFLRKPERERSSYRFHANLFWLQAILSTLIWSTLIFLFHGPKHGQFLTVYALVTGGIACVAISSLAHLPKIYPTYVTGMLGPISVYFIWIGPIENVFVGTTALLFLGFGVLLSKRLRRNIVNSISLELNNQKLVESLRDKNLKSEQLNRTLQDEISKRQQTETDLMVAIAEAQAASKAKSDFLAVISHEIRTPMNGILGMLDLVADTSLDKLQRDYIETANHSAETLLRLLNDLLDFSKTDQGGLPLEKTAFQLKETIREIASLMAGRAKKKGLKFKFDCSEDFPDWVYGDSIRFRQIMGNLLGNAVKFTEKGEVKLSLERYERIEDKLRYYFSITDTGIGIASEALENLFEPFTQVDSSMTRKYGGTGLGLAISKQLIEKMDGKIHVSSELKQGSTFTFYLTFTEPGPYEIEKKVASSEAPGEVSYTGRVLVVEDDPISQRVIRLLLERIGLEVQLAENGEIGFKKAVGSHWDLVFMDCRMPVLDGISATQKIRAYEAEHGLSHTPIIALTANAKDSDRLACKAAGMDDFVAKPIRNPALAEILDAWLKHPSHV